MYLSTETGYYSEERPASVGEKTNGEYAYYPTGSFPTNQIARNENGEESADRISPQSWPANQCRDFDAIMKKVNTELYKIVFCTLKQ